MITTAVLAGFHKGLIKIAEEKAVEKPVEKPVEKKSPIWDISDIKGMAGKAIAKYKEERKFMNWATRLSEPETGGGKYFRKEPLTPRGPFGKWQMYMPFIKQHGPDPNVTAKQVSSWDTSKFVPALKSFWNKTSSKFVPGKPYTKQLSEAGLPEERHKGAYTAMVHYMGPGGFRRHVKTHGPEWMDNPPAGPFENMRPRKYLTRMYPEHMAMQVAGR